MDPPNSFEQVTLLRLIMDTPGIYLHELQAKLLAKFGVTVATSTICRTLKFMGCTRQVIQHIALQQSEQLMTLQCLSGWTKVGVTGVIVHENGVTALGICHQETTGC